MIAFKKAERLEEISHCVDYFPLRAGDPRYVSMSDGRNSNALEKLRLCVQDHDARANTFAKAVLLGHRGCGKSTELFRLEHEMSDRFTCLHLTPDDSLLPDYDYTDMLLWLVESLVQRFAQAKISLAPALVEGVVQWFAERSIENVASLKTQLELETEAQTKAKLGVFWLSLQLLARLKSMVVGDVERRKIVRQTLQRYSTELLQKVNTLLDEARRSLSECGHPPDLLIVQDNLDRLTVDAARRLYFDYGDLLKQLRAHLILTAPIPMLLAPWNLGAVFENTFTMPMIKVHDERGRESRPGLASLVRLVEARLVVPKIFKTSAVVRFLVKMSGGSVRDLVRILNNSQLEARADRKAQIDLPSAMRAVRVLQQDYERLLVPADVYFRFLAVIHRGKRDWGAFQTGSASPDKVSEARLFFAELLANGAVIEYNGGKTWYDAHPALWGSEAFRNACEKLQASAASPA